MSAPISSNAKKRFQVRLQNLEDANEILDKIDSIDDSIQTALDGKQDSLVGTDNQLFYQTAPNVISPIPSFFIDPNMLGLRLINAITTDNTILHNYEVALRPEADNVGGFTVKNNNIYSNSDYNSSIFSRYVTLNNNSIYHERDTDIGEINFHSNSLTVGDGSSVADFNGFSYSYGFGNIRKNVNVTGPVQGYSFQPTFEDGSTIDENTCYVQSFYDSLSGSNTMFGYYTSFNASPNLRGIKNNRNFTGLNINPSIAVFEGNASFTGIGVYGQLSDFETGNYTGINVSPNINNIEYANGISINMNNVNASLGKVALQTNGDVQINGNLSFTGAFSSGQLQAYYQTNLVDNGGDPAIGHNLFAAGLSPANTTTANIDYIANIANGYVRMEENSIATSGPFSLGFAAFVTPCIIDASSGSTLDFVTSNAAVIIADELGTAGTVDTAKNYRAVTIPNGLTTITNHRGFQFDLPFGMVGTTTHAFYTSEEVNNYFKGNLVVGELTETPANSNVAIEISSTTKAFLNARMIESERDTLSALDGMQIYNLTTNKLQVYASGSWIDLH